MDKADRRAKPVTGDARHEEEIPRKGAVPAKRVNIAETTDDGRRIAVLRDYGGSSRTFHLYHLDKRCFSGCSV